MERLGPTQNVDRAAIVTRPLVSGNPEQRIRVLRQEKPAGSDFSWLEIGAGKGPEYSQNPIAEAVVPNSGRIGPSENHD